MRAPSEAELLALWDRGSRRHPVDRALLLGVWARPDLPPSSLPDLPLGALNAALLRLREVCFGPRIDAYLDCEHCGERLELVLDTGQLLAGAAEDDVGADAELAGLRFRAPCSRDLAAIAQAPDPETAALSLLIRCCVEPQAASREEILGLLPEAEARLEALDPAADIRLAVSCDSCGHHWVADFDIGAILWDEVSARARTLLEAVHRLARAYGWTESEILALSPQRRSAYLELVDA